MGWHYAQYIIAGIVAVGGIAGLIFWNPEKGEEDDPTVPRAIRKFDKSRRAK